MTLLGAYSHKGFLPRFVNHLKNMKFLREDLVFSIHSEEVTLLLLGFSVNFEFLQC